jgi:TRAP transporter TAXI family solute receptor
MKYQGGPATRDDARRGQACARYQYTSNIMAEGLHRLHWWRGCLVVLTAALAAAVFSSESGYARSRSAQESSIAPVDGESINANTIAIVSGNPNGTYLYLAYDLSAVLDDGNDFRVLPIIGKGGAQNVRDVRYLKGVDLGITQSIILNTFRKTRELGKIDNAITYITKLYNEEMHLVVHADSGITSINQLDGKKVNFSDVGSGTQLSTRDIFEKLGIKPIEVNMGQADALRKLQTGEIAATVLIAGKPTGSVGKAKSSDGFRLLSVPFAKELQADYLPAKLTSGDYPNLIEPDHSVDTIAVGAVLIAYNWPRNTDRYRRIEKFVEHFFPRIAEFQKPPRHPKWSETNLAAVIPGWKRFPAAEEWLKRHSSSSPSAFDQREQFDRFLKIRPQASSEASTPEDRDRLFEEFLRWNETRENR